MLILKEIVINFCTHKIKSSFSMLTHKAFVLIQLKIRLKRFIEPIRIVKAITGKGKTVNLTDRVLP